MGRESEGILVAEHVFKHFGGTKALDDVSFCLKAGEVHALMGENGAGKSTLGKIFAGVHKADSGKISFMGQEVHFDNPRTAKEVGVSIVLQEFNLLPDLSVAENLVIGNNRFYKHGILNKKEMYTHSRRLLHLFNMDESLDIYTKVRNLSVAQMQVLEILKAVDSEAKVIILDEPTATLSPNEIEQLFVVVRQLKTEKNISFIIVSHKIEEIFAISDRVTVLRDGMQVLDGEDIHNMTEQGLVKSMVGREINNLYGSRQFGTCNEKEVVFRAEHICDYAGRVKHISLELKKGEIVGLTGIVGAGRSEFARCVSGIDPMRDGKVFVHGKELPWPSIKQSVRNGISYVPEDRKNDGLILNESIMQNISMVKQAFQKKPAISSRQSIANSENMRQNLLIKIRGHYDPVNSLSGGNQQKVMLGKWLIMNPDILILDEPTRGIDISAKSEIYTILNKLSKDGISILLISSEFLEIIGMCDRAIVMREGCIAGELEHSDLTESAIATLATVKSEGEA